MRSDPNKIAKDYARRAMASARAAKGWSWSDVSELLTELGIEQTPNNLTTKQSRAAFRAPDFLLMLRAMGVLYVDLSKLDIPGMDEIIRKIDRRRSPKT